MPYCILQVDEGSEMDATAPTSPPKSELALQKGFRRRTWTGPAWLDNVTSTGHVRLDFLFETLAQIPIEVAPQGSETLSLSRECLKAYLREGDRRSKVTDKAGFVFSCAIPVLQHAYVFFSDFGSYLVCWSCMAKSAIVHHAYVPSTFPCW